MSDVSDDLTQFLDSVAKVAATTASSAPVGDDRWGPAESAGLWTLARDTAGEPDAMQWLGHTVRVASGLDPALGFVLASRFTADLAVDEGAAQEPAFALVSSLADPVVATSPRPDAVVVLDVDDDRISLVPWSDVEAHVGPRPGLVAAQPGSFVVPATATDLGSDPAAVLATWEQLIAASLIGIAEKAVELTASYVTERKQFGVPVGSFAGLRALVAGMSLRVEPAAAQLHQALRGHAPGDGVAALAGRAAVDNCLDAIQSHGGYGYIDEYPVAGLLRDAISLQARSGGRRLHVARVATRGLGAPVGRPS